MLYRDPKCVFVADTIFQADIVAAWLDGHGIRAEVMNREMMSGLVSSATSGLTGVEVWVLDTEQAAEAIRLLGDRAVELATMKPSGPPLEVECEECGEISAFPAQERGTVQTCPHCRAYIDVEPLDGNEGPLGATDSGEGEDEGPGTDAITDHGPWGVTT
jgi:hypothetical protein